MWFAGGTPVVFKRNEEEIYKSKHSFKGLYYKDSIRYLLEFTNESRNVSVVNDRLYFVTEIKDELVEYDLELLDEFIKEKMDYHPRVIADGGVSDFYVKDHKNIWTITADGDVKKLKSFNGSIL